MQNGENILTQDVIDGLRWIFDKTGGKAAIFQVERWGTLTWLIQRAGIYAENKSLSGAISEYKQAYFDSIREADRDGGVDLREGKLRLYDESTMFVDWIGDGDTIPAGCYIEYPKFGQTDAKTWDRTLINRDGIIAFETPIKNATEPETPSPECAFATTFDVEKFSKEVEDAARTLGSAAKGQIQPAIDAIRNAFENAQNSEPETHQPGRWRDPAVEMPPRNDSYRVDVKARDGKICTNIIVRVLYERYVISNIVQWRYSEGDPQ